MARGTTVRVDGLKELQKALKELPKSTQGAVLRRALKTAAEPMRAAAEANAPQNTGLLSAIIDVSTKTTKPQRKKEGRTAKLQSDGSFKSSKSTGAQIYIGAVAIPFGKPTKKTKRVGSTANRAIQQEFGNRNHPAQPFMRPAWDAHKQGALASIAGALGDEIDKAAKRLAAKQARAARKIPGG